MSYNGTVRCSHCYQTGHNKRACTELTTLLKARYEGQIEEIEAYRAMSDAEIERTNTDRQWNIDYHTNKANRARELYLKRTKIDLATGQKVTGRVAKAERMKSVTCGYCRVKGHTRRTCENVKNDYAIYAERTRQVRAEWYEKFKALGVGIGTMVIAKRNGFNPKTGEWGAITVTGLITGVEWEKVDAHSEGSPLKITTNAELRGERYIRNNIGDMSLGALDPESQYTHSKLTVSPTGKVPAMPTNWTTDIKSIKEVFSTKEERSWDYRYGYSDGDHAWQEEARQRLNLPKCAYSS
jgi:hypothetical protein